MIATGKMLTIWLLLGVAAAELSCKDHTGQSVDWWTGYKMPDSVSHLNNSGYALAYWNSADPDSWYWETIDSDYDEVGTTAIYHSTIQLPYMNGSTTSGYLVYNDQWCACPEGKYCFVAQMWYDRSFCPQAYNETDPKTGRTETKCSCNYQPFAPGHEGSYEDADRDPTGKKFGHAKGFLIFDGEAGVWMQHSVPGFPISADVYKYYGWGWYKLENGQHLHCMTLSPEAVEAVAKMLTYSYVLPQRQSYGIPDALRARYPTVASIVDGMAANGSYPTSHGAASVAIETRGGVPLVAFGKEGDDGDRWDGNATSPPFEIALWEDHVAPTLETSLFVESWCVCNFDREVADRRAFCANETASEYLCGPEGCICDTKKPENDDAYCCEKSACDAEHRVQQIERLDWHGRVVANRTVNSILTHAKWGISQDAAKPWVCFGDINRQYSQRKRGGGAACMRSPEAWRLLTDLHLDAPAAQIDSCD